MEHRETHSHFISISTVNMVNLLNAARNNFTKELQYFDTFCERLRQYLIAAGLIFCSAIVIMLFHPTSLKAKVLIAFGFSLSFGLTIIIVFECLNFLNNRSKSPIRQYRAYRFWVISAVIFLLGFLVFSAGERYVLTLEQLDFLNFYRENLSSYRPFSPLFFAKMSPIFIIVSFNAFRALKSNSPIRDKPAVVGQEPLQINLGGDVEILDPSSISHISVQEHYSCFYIKVGESRKEIEVHLSLTNALSNLPAESFVRVHRSHAVNLRHVSGLRKIANVPHIIIGADEFVVPVSRRQYSEAKKRVAEYRRAT